MCSKRKCSPSSLSPRPSTDKSSVTDPIARNTDKQPNLTETIDKTIHRKIVILRLKNLLSRVGLSRSTVYNLLKPGGKYFDPAFAVCKVQLTQKSVGFIESEVNHWLETKKATTRWSVAESRASLLMETGATK